MSDDIMDRVHMYKSSMVILKSALILRESFAGEQDKVICLDDMEAEIYNIEEEIKVMRERIDRLMEADE